MNHSRIFLCASESCCSFLLHHVAVLTPVARDLTDFGEDLTTAILLKKLAWHVNLHSFSSVQDVDFGIGRPYLQRSVLSGSVSEGLYSQQIVLTWPRIR